MAQQYLRDEKGQWAGSTAGARDVPTASPILTAATADGEAVGGDALREVVARYRPGQSADVDRIESSVWVDGMEVVVFDARPMNGPEVGTVVFVHGWGLGPKSYESTVDAMVARGYRVVTPALPGFGGSDFLPGDVARQEIVARTAEHVHAALMEYDVPRPWHLVGHSFGGGVATSVTAQTPQDVSSLLLLSPIGGDTAPGSWMRALMSLSGEIQHSSLDRVRDALPTFTRGLGRALSIGIAAKGTDLSGPLSAAARAVPVTMVVADSDRVTPAGRLRNVPGLVTKEVSGSHGWLLSGKGPATAADLLGQHLPPA